MFFEIISNFLFIWNTFYNRISSRIFRDGFSSSFCKYLVRVLLQIFVNFYIWQFRASNFLDNIFSKENSRTFCNICITRLGCAIPVPFVTSSALTQMFSNGNMLTYLDMMSGGALSRCTLFALGVTPYINASIIVQLLTVAIPSLENIAKEPLTEPISFSCACKLKSSISPFRMEIMPCSLAARRLSPQSRRIPPC